MKTILIKATVPDDFKDDGIRIYDTGSGVYIPKGQYEIIEPPSDKEIDEAFPASTFDNTRAERLHSYAQREGAKWALKKMGL